MRETVKNAAMIAQSVLRRDSAPKVVFYHDIGRRWTHMGTDVKTFVEHMGMLRTLDVVCFDDGFRGIWDYKDLFNRCEPARKARKIVFLAVGLVGRPGYLTWEEIRDLQKEQGFEFQCHTWSHQTLAGPWNYEVSEPAGGRTDEWYRHELVDSKFEIEKHLEREVTAVCPPVGYFSDDVIRRCKEAGYKKVYTSYPGNLCDDYLQPRCLVQDLSPIVFKAVLNGGMMAFRRRYLCMHKF